MTFTNLTSGNSFNSGNNVFNTASITVVANRLYLLSVESFLNSGNVAQPTVTGAGQTWTLVGTQLRGTNGRISIFRAMPSSGNSGALAIDHGGQTQIACSWSVEEVTSPKTSGTNGSDAIAQVVGATSEATQTGITVNLAAFGSPNNYAYGAVLQQGGAVVTHGSGFTELTNIGATIQTLETQYKLNTTAVSWSWPSAASYQFALAVEVVEGTGISPSASASASASRSLSPSASQSPSGSKSPSSSVSPSISPSASVSSSVSASPSVGFEGDSKQESASLPTNSNDLTTLYSVQEEIDIQTVNGVYVNQTGTLDYIIHQFKRFVGLNSNRYITFVGKASLSPFISPVFLQVYNRVSGLWETIDSNNTSSSNMDFKLTYFMADFTNYKDADNVVACRVWQLLI